MAKSLQLSIPSGLNGTFKIKHKKTKTGQKRTRGNEGKNNDLLVKRLRV